MHTIPKLILFRKLYSVSNELLSRTLMFYTPGIPTSTRITERRTRTHTHTGAMYITVVILYAKQGNIADTFQGRCIWVRVLWCDQNLNGYIQRARFFRAANTDLFTYRPTLITSMVVSNIVTTIHLCRRLLPDGTPGQWTPHCGMWIKWGLMNW